MYVTKKAFKTLMGEVHEVDEDKANDTYSSFLNSSLNIELVHIILKSITEEVGGINYERDPLEIIVPCQKHFESKLTSEINEIKIEKADCWNVVDFGDDNEWKNISVFDSYFQEKNSKSLTIN